MAIVPVVVQQHHAVSERRQLKLAEQFAFPHEYSSSPSSGACVDVGLLQLMVLAAPQFL